MRHFVVRFAIVACLMTGFHPAKLAAAELFGLTPGTVELKSAGPLAFGPSNVLFVSDPMAAKIYAINTDDKGSGSASSYDIADLKQKVAEAAGGSEASISDLAVNPETGNAFLSVTVDGNAHIVKVTPSGDVSPLKMDKVAHAAVTLPNPPADKEIQTRRGPRNMRGESITDLAYTSGRVLVAGLTEGDSPSSVREFDFPFNESASGFSVEIFHAAHGRNEDSSPIQAFVPFNIGGEAALLAGYTCTPLVKIPISKIDSEAKVKGTTVAELGNRNRPLDMIVYKKDGKDYVLMANGARGVMKVSTEDLEQNQGLTEKVDGGGTAGQPYETVGSWENVSQLDKLSDSMALVMIESDDSSSLKSVELP